MKKFLAILPLLLAGCIVDAPPSVTTVKVTECPLMASASSTTGTTNYACERLACDNEDFTFRCEFTNVSQENQPGVAIRIGLYSDKTNQEVLRSPIIFANSLKPGQSDVKILRWNKARINPICGSALENCTFLTDHVWPK